MSRQSIDEEIRLRQLLRVFARQWGYGIKCLSLVKPRRGVDNDDCDKQSKKG